MRKKKLAIICAPGLDTFLAWAPRLADEYEVSIHSNGKIPLDVVNSDVIWLEWANEFAVEITRMIVERVCPFDKIDPDNRPKVVVRLHSYEAFTNMPGQIRLYVVDHLVCVADHVREINQKYNPNVLRDSIDTTVIPNGVDVDNIEPLNPGPGFNIAVVSSINHKKNPALVLQIAHELVKKNREYMVHWAGVFQDPRYEVYLKHMVKEMGLEYNVKFYGHVDDMEAFWHNKNYLLHTSIHEGHSYAIMEAMARGIKPVIHNYYGASEQYPEKLLFNTVAEAVEMMPWGVFCFPSGAFSPRIAYRSKEYRKQVERSGWTLDNQVKAIREMLGGLQ